uniref:Uncharacterized protein n=1 Tax=Salix viminalis TaxID=40686 RepID=A0A6N2KEV2_SALVM
MVAGTASGHCTTFVPFSLSSSILRSGLHLPPCFFSQGEDSWGQTYGDCNLCIKHLMGSTQNTVFPCFLTANDACSFCKEVNFTSSVM